jgi:predicted phage terminase large subunit-like protein
VTQVTQTLLAIRQNRWIPADPRRPSSKQAAFLSLLGREAFYGGAAGGGKSEALLMAALMYVDHPGYAALLLRRTYADLSKPGALMSRAHDWLGGTAARWNDNEHTYTFPSGAKLSFGYLDTERDKYQYQGAEYTFVGFDELTQFREADYTYLFSRLRRKAGSDIPLRMRAASNPGGFGHDWVLQRFLVEGETKGRPFISAFLRDNPGLDAEEYVQNLSELDPATRQQLLDGNWFAKPPGRKFRREWFEIVDIAPTEMDRVRWWDLASTEAPKPRVGKRTTDPDWTAGVKVGRTAGGLYFVEDIQHMRGRPREVKQLVRQTAELDGIAVDVYMEQEPGSSGVTVIDDYRTLLDGYTFRGLPSTGNKEVRANPASSQAEAANVKLVRGPWINDFLSELEQFPDPSVHDDQVDAFSGAMAQLAKRAAYSDEDYAMGVWRCEGCGHGFVWQPQRPCPQCGKPAPADYPAPETAA